MLWPVVFAQEKIEKWAASANASSLLQAKCLQCCSPATTAWIGYWICNLFISFVFICSNCLLGLFYWYYIPFFIASPLPSSHEKALWEHMRGKTRQRLLQASIWLFQRRFLFGWPSATQSKAFAQQNGLWRASAGGFCLARLTSSNSTYLIWEHVWCNLNLEQSLWNTPSLSLFL